MTIIELENETEVRPLVISKLLSSLNEAEKNVGSMIHLSPEVSPLFSLFFYTLRSTFRLGLLFITPGSVLSSLSSFHQLKPLGISKRL